MPIVRLSGIVRGRKDPNREARAKLLYRLFDAGWDIYNGNGDQVITLGNIQEKIIESDAFVFTADATLEDMFKAASIFVGYQTNDKDLEGKSTVILNSDGSWNSLIDLINHLHEMGTVKQYPETFLKIVEKPRQVVDALEECYQEGTPTFEKKYQAENFPPRDGSSKPDFNVCVFCSASIDKQEYLDLGFNLGRELALEGWGCISGAGRTGIMGQIVKGSVSENGWTAGSNVPHIIEMEGLPEGMSEFWPRPDIYTRMEIMIEESSAFVALPGGIGTVQEVLALIIMKQQNDKIMQGKSIIIVDILDSSGKNFWTPLLDMLEKHGASGMYHVVKSSQEIVAKLREIK